MSHRILLVDFLFHDTILVNANGGQNVQNTLVHGIQAINDKRHRDLLPSRIAFFSALPPVLGLFGFADVPNIKHDTVQGARVKSFVFVVRCDRDEKFGFAVVHLRPQ